MNTETFSGRYRGRSANPAHQRGAVLIVSLLMLVVMTLVGVTGIQMTSMEERMSGNARDRNLAFQAAEAALRSAEGVIAAQVQAETLAAFELNFPVSAGTGTYYHQNTVPSGLLKGEADSWAAIPANYTGELAGVTTLPKYVMENWVVAATPLAVPPVTFARHYFRITAYATGGTSNAVVVLQSLYEVQVP